MSGIDKVRLIGFDFELVDTDPDTDCGVIGVVSAINSIVNFRASGLVQQGAVERVTMHPPGSRNFANWRMESLALLFACIIFPTIANPSSSEMCSVIDWNSSLLSRIKLAKEVMGALKGAFRLDIVVSGTVSNPASSVMDPPAFAFPSPVALRLDDIIDGFGMMRIVVSQEFFLFERLDVDASDPATRENIRWFPFVLSTFVAFAVNDFTLTPLSSSPSTVFSV